MEDIYMIMLAFVLNLTLLLLSEILGMTKSVQPNSVTQLLASIMAKIIEYVEKRSEPIEPLEPSQE